MSLVPVDDDNPVPAQQADSLVSDEEVEEEEGKGKPEFMSQLLEEPEALDAGAPEIQEGNELAPPNPRVDEDNPLPAKPAAAFEPAEEEKEEAVLEKPQSVLQLIDEPTTIDVVAPDIKTAAAKPAEGMADDTSVTHVENLVGTAGKQPEDNPVTNSKSAGGSSQVIGVNLM